MLKKMLVLQAPHDRIVFSCWENELEKIKLLQRFQFQLFRKTYMEKYEVSALLKKTKRNNITSSITVTRTSINTTFFRGEII